MADTTVSVLCAFPVSTIYDFNHRFAYYVALAIILVAPRHRWFTPAAIAFVTLYSLFSTLYIAAISIAPTRLGPTLDVFALNSLFLTNTYALATVVFCRSDIIRGKRGWVQCMRSFVWLWVGFITATLAKSRFERFAQDATVEVQCFARDAAHSAENLFAFGKDLACVNPCVVPETSVAHRLQEQLSPMVWGSLNPTTNSFSKMAIPELSMSEHLIVILFAVALASTLWVNFFFTKTITRNTIFAALVRGKTDSRMRVWGAKIAAAAWYGWSYLVLLLVACSTPFVSYVQEQLMVRYSVAQSSCLAKQWLPWIIGVAIFLIKIAAHRRRREVLSKEKACRIRRFNTALRTLQGSTEHAELLPEHLVPDEKSAPVEIEQAIPVSRPATPTPGLHPGKKHRIDIVEPRKVDGLRDTFVELKEWWCNPTGVLASEESSTTDPEKALLLKGHF